MNVANVTRAAIFISAILLVVAVALDEYLTADVDGGDADFGAFNSIYSVAGDKYDVKILGKDIMLKHVKTGKKVHVKYKDMGQIKLSQ